MFLMKSVCIHEFQVTSSPLQQIVGNKGVPDGGGGGGGEMVTVTPLKLLKVPGLTPCASEVTPFAEE